MSTRHRLPSPDPLENLLDALTTSRWGFRKVQPTTKTHPVPSTTKSRQKVARRQQRHNKK